MATDIAARGIDIDALPYVVNFPELPNVAEDYVHRIRRTSRPARKARAISWSAIDERGNLKDIESSSAANCPKGGERFEPSLHAQPGRRPSPAAASLPGRRQAAAPPPSRRASAPAPERQPPPDHSGRRRLARAAKNGFILAATKGIDGYVGAGGRVGFYAMAFGIVVLALAAYVLGRVVFGGRRRPGRPFCSTGRCGAVFRLRRMGLAGQVRPAAAGGGRLTDCAPPASSKPCSTRCR